MNVNKIIICEDGTKTLESGIIGETYHSSESSIDESVHVYLNNGLSRRIDGAEGEKTPLHIKIAEAGFGTGLNALLCALFTAKRNMDGPRLAIEYITTELFPISIEESEELEFDKMAARVFPEFDRDDVRRIFNNIHGCAWEEKTEILPGFFLTKLKRDMSSPEVFSEHVFSGTDVCFYDAFSPDRQPDLWTESIFSAIYKNMNANGILSTYSAKGTVKENLRRAGFEVKRLKGFGHKRHMVIARKTGMPE